MENDNQNRNLYQRLDDTIMKGVNTGVRAWNWTTGRTKTDLALSSLYGGPMASAISLGVSTGNSNNIFPAILASSILGSVATGVNWALWGDEIKSMSEKEVRAAEKNSLSLEVEKYKHKCAFMGPAYGMLAGALEFLNNSLERTILLGSTSASFYVMRADYLPPRKNCMSRGVEKLVDAVKKIELPTIPNPFPQPVPVTNYEVI